MKAVKLAALLLLALAPACASDPITRHPANVEIQREISEIILRVRKNTGPALYDDLKRLVAYDVFSIEQVSDLVKDPNARLRSNALWVLSQIRDPERPDTMKRIDRILHSCLDDSDPSVRLEAAAGLAARGDWEVLPVLMEGLESPDSGVRYRCHEQLVITTSQDFGFLVDGTADERAAGLERWRAWHAAWKRSQS